MSLPSYDLGGGYKLGGFVNIGDILLSLSDAIDLVIFLERLMGLIDLFTVEDFSRDRDST